VEFKFMRGLFGQNTSSKNVNPIEHATSGTLAATSGAATSVFDQTRGGWDIDRAVAEGMERVIWIFRCVDVIATNFAGLLLNGRKGDPVDGEKFDLDEEVFRLLNRRPNTYETAQQFKYRLISQVVLSKRGAFIELERSNGGGIAALHLLPPQMVEPIPDPRKYLLGYRLKKAGAAGEDRVDPENIIWVRTRPHPLDPYSQITPLSAAGIVAETDFLARLFNRNFLYNDGRPTTLVTVQGELDPDDAEEIKMRFSGGPMFAGRTTVIEADGITVADLSASPRDVQWLEGLKASKEDILLAFGVPESVMGNASGRTFDNADAEREGFWKDTMLPLSDGISRCLDPLTGDINDDQYIAPYYDKIDVLQRAERAKHDKLLTEWQEGAITLNDYLEGTGRKRLDNVPGADARFMGNGLVLVDPSDYEAIKKIPNVLPAAAIAAARGEQMLAGAGGGALGAGPTGAGPNAGPAGGDPAQADFDSVLAQRMSQFIGSSKRLALPSTKSNPEHEVISGEVVEPQGKADPRGQLRTALEGQVHAVLSSWSNAQEEIIPVRLTHAKALKYTRHWVGDSGQGDKALSPAYAVQGDRWKADLDRNLRSTLNTTIVREMKRAASEMDTSGFLRLMGKHGMLQNKAGLPTTRLFGSADGARAASASVLDSLMEIATKAAERQSQRVADRISEMDSEGKSIAQIQKEVKRMIGERSAWRRGLATFLTTAAIEGSQEAVWSKSGPITEKVWNTAGDESVRATHRVMDGVTVLSTKDFLVGGVPMAHPCDPKGGPAETANCRCWSDRVVAPAFAEEYDSV